MIASLLLSLAMAGQWSGPAGCPYRPQPPTRPPLPGRTGPVPPLARVVCPPGSYTVVVPDSPVIIKTPTSVTIAWSASVPSAPPAVVPSVSFIVDTPITISIAWP